MIRAIIRSNGYPQHTRLFRFTKEGREVVVNPAADKSIDKPGEPLVLTEGDYAYIKKEAGGSLVIEPLGDASGSAVAERISELEAQVRDRDEQIRELCDVREAQAKRVAELEAQLAAGATPADPGDGKKKK
jgi:hypothetical protein